MYTNFIAYKSSNGFARVGHYDQDTSLIQPLALASGAPVENLYQVIEVGASTLISDGGNQLRLDSLTLLPPLTGRDVLCVGKNYAEHAKEFNQSGYDASDKVDQPTHPVIFTKRSTSIVPSGADILPLSHFTETLDYEGEIGVIIGTSGYRITEEDAINHVWGYTIINDVTARERQRDHKQFYLGKSADTFCPMGPIAKPKEQLPSRLTVQTFVNGSKRQEGTTDDLIFSISKLVATLSEGTTLRAGDVIATGTPAGVGFGLDPPQFLKPGDLIEISVTGLGTLYNRVAHPEAENKVALNAKLHDTHLKTYNLDITSGGMGLSRVNGKLLNVIQSGVAGGERITYVHGLGGTVEYWMPLISTLQLDKTYENVLFDLEGHGLSTTSASSVVTISSYAADLAAIFIKPFTKPSILIAQGMGCLVALTFACTHPDLVTRLILLGPLPHVIPPVAADAHLQIAVAVRAQGMFHSGTVAGLTDTLTSKKTKESRPLALSAVRQFLLSQDPEGFAKGCTALAGATEELDMAPLRMPVLIITGDENDRCTPKILDFYQRRLKDCRVEVMNGVGHWHVTEDADGVALLVKSFLRSGGTRN